MTEDAAPECTIIAGPNGAGKSTVVQDLNPPGEFVNADEYARRINPVHPESASVAAGKEVLDRLHTLIAQQQSFHYETTLSSHQALSLMANCREAGYQVNLVFLLLESPALNIARVRTRVANGGHDIPAPTILRRYHKGLERLSAAMSNATTTIIYDNTSRDLIPLIRINNDDIEANILEEAKALHVRLAEAVATALDISTDAVFRAGRYGM